MSFVILENKPADLFPEYRRALFSEDMRHRFILEVIWDERKDLVQFIGLNPSTADHTKDDPTLRRCKDFAKGWNCGGLLMTNVFSFRATDPNEMKAEAVPTLKENDTAIALCHVRAAFTIAAWGVDGAHLEQDQHVKSVLDFAFTATKRRPFCLGKTEGGHPRHPLYLKKTTQTIPL